MCAAVAGAALMALLLFCYCKHRKQANFFKEPPHEPSTLSLSSDANCRAYTFRELSTVTKHFNDSELLSSGAFGDVYRGTPPARGRLVAVKRIKQEMEHGQASFLAEAEALKQIRHHNLLPLRGWREAKEGLFPVYDFMSNSSLDKWLYLKPSPNQATEGLSWDLRHHILAGVASGLEYLHEWWVQCVLHRDIKSSNVMLDANFNAYLSDFGLARLVDHQKLQKTKMLAGTLGYMAPEMHFSGRATTESDVYAFGVLVLEVVCGRRPFLEMEDGDEPGDFLLLERVWRAHEAGHITKVVDPRLLEQFNKEILISDPPSDRDELSLLSSDGLVVEGNLATIANALHLGLLGCLPNPSDRPSMRLVNQWFQSSDMGAMEFPSLPARKPAPHAQFYNWTSESSEGTTSSSRATSSDVTRFSVQSVGSYMSNSAHRGTQRSNFSVVYMKRRDRLNVISVPSHGSETTP